MERRKNIRWKVAVEGRGPSNPIVAEGKAFVLTAIRPVVKDKSISNPREWSKAHLIDLNRPNTQQAFAVICLDRKTGKSFWQEVSTTKNLHEDAHNDTDFPSASPTTDRNYLYCSCGSAERFFHDLHETQIWDKAQGRVKAESILGEGCSPILNHDNLITVRGPTAQHTMPEDLEKGTTCPIPQKIERSGKTQITTATSRSLRSQDLEKGDIIRRCNELTKTAIPCPAFDGDHVICMSSDKLYTPIATRNIACVPQLSVSVFVSLSLCLCSLMPHTGRQYRKHAEDSSRVTKSK